MKTVATGGAGLIDSKVAARLRGSHHDDVLAAAPNSNSVMGEAFAAALENCNVVIDLANSPSADRSAAEFLHGALQELSRRRSAPAAGNHHER